MSNPEKRAPNEEKPSLLDTSYYLFASASELFPGSFTGQGAFLAKMCKLNQLDPEALKTELLNNPVKLKGLMGMATRRHSQSKRNIPRTQLTDVKGAVTNSFDVASGMMMANLETLRYISSSYASFIEQPYIPPQNLEHLTLREARYREFANEIISKLENKGED